MGKKKFRAVSQEPPRYPKASELSQSSLRKLGLVALGGLLLGGPGSRVHAEESKDVDAKSARKGTNPAGGNKGKPSKDASTPIREPRFMPNGGKPASRVVEVDSPTPARSDEKVPPPKPGQKNAATTGTKTSTDTAAPMPPPGEPPAARVPPEEKAPVNKGGSTAGKTDSKKQPEFLPPPGAPPLPHKPEAAPAPKKTK